MAVPEQGAYCWLLVAEGHLAGSRYLQTHLVLDVGDVDAVALAQLASLEVDVELGNQEEGQALGACHAAFGASQDKVHDVVVEVRLGRGDEALDAGDVPRAVGLLDCFGPARAHVRARVGLGEHHGGAPLFVDYVAGQLLLVLGAKVEQDSGEGEAGRVHVYGGV